MGREGGQVWKTRNSGKEEGTSSRCYQYRLRTRRKARHSSEGQKDIQRLAFDYISVHNKKLR